MSAFFSTMEEQDVRGTSTEIYGGEKWMRKLGAEQRFLLRFAPSRPHRTVEECSPCTLGASSER